MNGTKVQSLFCFLYFFCFSVVCVLLLTLFFISCSVFAVWFLWDVLISIGTSHSPLLIINTDRSRNREQHLQ